MVYNVALVTGCYGAQCQKDLTNQLGTPAVALLPLHTSSPERRITQKEIIAGEERPRYLLQLPYKSSPGKSFLIKAFQGHSLLLITFTQIDFTQPCNP